jgi:hypothetical protein
MGIKSDGLTDGWTYKESKQIKRLRFLTYRQTDRHVNVWTERQTDGWMNGQIQQNFKCSVLLHSVTG